MKLLEIISKAREIVKDSREHDFRGDLRFSEEEIVDEILGLIDKSSTKLEE